MRHRAAYRHARHRPGRPGWPYLVTLLAVLGMIATALTLAARPPAARAQAAPVTVLADRGAEQAASAGMLAQEQERAQLGAVRVSLAAAQARAALAAATYTVRNGDSMSRVAQSRCGAARDWTGVYAASRARHWTAADANVLSVGQHLFLACAWRPSMLRFAPAPPPPPRPVITATTLRRSTALASAGTRTPVYRAPVYRTPVYRTRSATSATYRSSSRGSYGNVSASSYGSGYQACVIARESGGSSQVMNASGHYGLYQFDYGTWVSGGGSGSDFGHASIAEQNRVFAAVYAARGTQPWSPSDGC